MRLKKKCFPYFAGLIFLLLILDGCFFARFGVRGQNSHKGVCWSITWALFLSLNRGLKKSAAAIVSMPSLGNHCRNSVMSHLCT